MSDEKFKLLDPDNMFGHIYGFADQLESAMEIGKTVKLKHDYSSAKNILFAGMGGSAIAGDVASAVISENCNIPSVVNRNYSLPQWVNESTLVICLSYSGNTEETLSCMEEALSKGAMTLGITTGGELVSKLEEQGKDVVKIPEGFPPRAALGYLFIPILYVLKESGVLDNLDETALSSSINQLRLERDIFSVEGEENRAKEVAQTIYSTVPIIYGEAQSTAVAALRWRGQLEENAKMVAFHHVLPEMNHNEIVGYENNPELLSNLGIIWLTDKSDHERNRRRRELTKSIIGEKVLYQFDITGKGNSYLERLIYLIHFGDWVSYWCAIFHETDPTPVESITQLKKLLSE